MKIVNKIFSGIRKVIAFPFTAAGLLIILSGIIITAAGINISGNAEKFVDYLNNVIDNNETEENFIEDESEEWQDKKLNT